MRVICQHCLLSVRYPAEAHSQNKGHACCRCLGHQPGACFSPSPR